MQPAILTSPLAYHCQQWTACFENLVLCSTGRSYWPPPAIKSTSYWCRTCPWSQNGNWPLTAVSGWLAMSWSPSWRRSRAAIHCTAVTDGPWSNQFGAGNLGKPNSEYCQRISINEVPGRGHWRYPPGLVSKISPRSLRESNTTKHVDWIGCLSQAYAYYA